jgi:hypothetical protein
MSNRRTWREETRKWSSDPQETVYELVIYLTAARFRLIAVDPLSAYLVAMAVASLCQNMQDGSGGGDNWLYERDNGVLH